MNLLIRACFVCSVLFLVFLAGFSVYHFKTFPYSLLRDLHADLRRLQDTVGLGRPHHLFKQVYTESGVRELVSTEVDPGVTLITGYWQELDGGPGIMLVNHDGETVHSWNAHPLKLGYTTKTYTYVHGTYLFPNGDILFNLEFLGLVRLGPCGTVRWVSDFQTHHSIEITEDGNFWVPGNVTLSAEETKAYPGLVAPVYDDRLLLVSPAGEIQKDISFTKVIYSNNLQWMIRKARQEMTGDVFHVNDIQPIPKNLVDEYSGFSADVILVSSRQLNAVFAIDPNTEKVVWHHSGNLIKQHDPDFIGNGMIGIFNNNPDGSHRGQILGGSSLEAVSTISNETQVMYRGSAAHPFYTSAGGKWQLLENGNILAVEARAGRVFEVSEKGKLVWEWIQPPYGNELVSSVLEATRYKLTNEQQAAYSNCSQM